MNAYRIVTEFESGNWINSVVEGDIEAFDSYVCACTAAILSSARVSKVSLLEARSFCLGIFETWVEISYFRK